jgi:hypothetical protein
LASGLKAAMAGSAYVTNCRHKGAAAEKCEQRFIM